MRTNISNAVQDLSRLQRIMQQAISNAEDDRHEDEAWKTAYELVFSMSSSVRETLASLGMSMQYYDPDTSYEEDVRAYVDALHETVERLRMQL